MKWIRLHNHVLFFNRLVHPMEEELEDVDVVRLDLVLQKRLWMWLWRWLTPLLNRVSSKQLKLALLTCYYSNWQIVVW